MLNDWSDRCPRRLPRAFYRRGEFWLGLFTIMVSGGFLLGLFSYVVD